MGQEVEQGWRGSRAGTHSHSTGWSLTQGSTRSLTHSLSHSVAPSRGTFTSPLLTGQPSEQEWERDSARERRRSAQCVRFVYFLFTLTAHAPLSSPSLTPLSLRSPRALSAFFELLQPDWRYLFYSMTFGVRSLALALAPAHSSARVLFFVSHLSSPSLHSAAARLELISPHKGEVS